MTWSPTALAACAVVWLASAAAAAETAAVNFHRPAPAKLLYNGWDTPDAAFTRKHIREMEANTPFDGITIRLNGKGTTDAGETVDYSSFAAMGGPTWKYEWFQKDIDDLKNTDFRQFTDNFIIGATNPGILDWFDDEAWKAACGNYGILARIAKETGMKGVCFDIEQYDKATYTFHPELGRGRAETERMARQRGREFGKAMFDEYPDMVLLTFYWFSLHFDQAETLSKGIVGPYALAVPFFNGVYDVLPPEVIVLDSHEMAAYRAKTPADYYKMRHDLWKYGPPQLDESNVAKFGQTRLSPPSYMDAYFAVKPDSPWYIGPTDGKDSMAVFLEGIKNRLDVSDGYVWVYGERHYWWRYPETRAEGTYWESIQPGLAEAMRFAHRGLEYLKAGGEGPDPTAAYIARRGLKNAVTNNPGFESASTDGVPNWSFYQDKGTDGVARTAAGEGVDGSAAVRVERADQASLTQSFPVADGQTYLVRAQAKVEGGGQVSMKIAWQRPDGSWNWARFPTQTTLFADPLPGGWRLAQILTAVPPGAGRLAVMLCIEGQTDKADKVWFDNVEAYLLGPADSAKK